MQRRGRVRTAAAYFRQALNANYANWKQGDTEQQLELTLPGATAAMAPPKAPVALVPDEQARAAADATRSLEAWLDSVGDERRSELEAAWLKTVIMSGIRNGYAREGMKHPMVRSDFYRWLRDSDSYTSAEGRE